MSDGQARDWTSSLVSEATFDDLTLLAARLSGTAMALISVRRRGDEWVRAVVGISDADLPRLQPFLDAVMAASEMVIIRDTLADPRFAASAAVVNGPNVRFFAGAPVMGPGGPIYGALGVFDVQPRDLSVDQTRALFVIARHVSAYFEQRREEVR